MTDDTELLRLYVEQRSEAAFASLVSRHIDMVYSSALRQTGGRHHLAQEVTQMVFCDLARKAATLVTHPVIPAWLHRGCRLSALNLLRRERRRQSYESAAESDPALALTGESTVNWREVGPVLDEAINGLSRQDRQAVLLRYFGGLGFGDIGRQLQLSENAARMKVGRALDKLRDGLARHGITSTASALGAALATQSVSAAPAGVAASIATTAFTTTGGATAGWLAFMTLPKLPLALTAALLVGGIAVGARQEAAASARAAKIESLASQNDDIPSLQLGNRRLAAAASEAQAPAADRATLPALRQLEKKLEQADVATKIPSNAHILNQTAGVFDVSKLDSQPTAHRLVRPQWPTEPGLTSTSAEVMVDFVVGSDGQVYNPVVLHSTDKAFENSAIAAVSQWVFSPGLMAGRSVNTRMQVPIVYTPGAAPILAPAAGTWF